MDINQPPPVWIMSSARPIASPGPAPPTPPGRKRARSPPSRDPRFSRRTPDSHIARIDAVKAVRGIAGDTAWASRLAHAYACREPLQSAERRRAILCLTSIADRVEGAIEEPASSSLN